MMTELEVSLDYPHCWRHELDELKKAVGAMFSCMNQFYASKMSDDNINPQRLQTTKILDEQHDEKPGLPEKPLDHDLPGMTHCQENKRDAFKEEMLDAQLSRCEMMEKVPLTVFAVNDENDSLGNVSLLHPTEPALSRSVDENVSWLPLSLSGCNQELHTDDVFDGGKRKFEMLGRDVGWFVIFADLFSQKLERRVVQQDYGGDGGGNNSVESA